MKKIIALKGTRNVGKTTSIREFYHRVLENYKVEIIVPNSARKTKEVFSIIKINDIIIGVCSAGDTDEVVEWQMEECVAHKCGIIICACRTRQGSYEMVRNYALENEYELDFIDVPEQSNETRNILFNRFINAAMLELSSNA